MAKDVTRYDLLISCPGDIQEELQIIEEVISQFNEQFSDTTGVMIRSKHWSKSSFSESGGKPQALLNKQFVNDCDAAIAVFWARFGTPTDQYGSGSEEEIEIMLEAGKQVFMGFCEREVKLQNVDYDQYQKVRAFREKYKDRGLFFTYSTHEEFRKTIFAHLTRFFLTKKDLDEIKAKKTPDLRIKSISDGKLCDSLVVSKFKPTGRKLKDQMREEIVAQFAHINATNLQKHEREVVPSYPLSEVMKGVDAISKGFHRPVLIPDNTQKYISTVAKHLEITLNNDFFSLGDLQENTMKNFSLYGSSLELEGDDDAKEKYYAINKLHKDIVELLDWGPFESNYMNLSCVRLALANEGKDFDEDIDVELKFPKGAVIWGDSIPKLSYKTKEYAVDHLSLGKIFGIPQAIQYEAYTFPEVKQNYSPTPANLYPFNTRNYSKDYQKKINGVFLYNYFEDDTNTRVKLHIDYLKHNNAMAFPSVIFVDENLSAIEYSITSKRNSEIVKGTISAISEN